MSRPGGNPSLQAPRWSTQEWEAGRYHVTQALFEGPKYESHCITEMRDRSGALVFKDDLKLTRDNKIQIIEELTAGGRWVVTTTNLDRRTGDTTERCERYDSSKPGARLLSVEEEGTTHKRETTLIHWKKTVMKKEKPDTVVGHTLITEWPALGMARLQDRLNNKVPSIYYDLRIKKQLNFKELQKRKREHDKQKKRAARDSRGS